MKTSVLLLLATTATLGLLLWGFTYRTSYVELLPNHNLNNGQSSPNPSSTETQPQLSYPPMIPQYLDHNPLDLEILPEIYHDLLPESKRLPEIFDVPEYRKLGRKLDTFLRRPILNHDEAVSENEAGCPRRLSDSLVNPDQYRGQSDFWESVDQKEIAKRRMEIVNALAKNIAEGQDVVGGNIQGRGKDESRGIVLTAGNQDTTARTIFLLRYLKRLGKTLPVEVFHYPDEMQHPAERRGITELGATLKEVQGVEKEPGAWKNWQIKGLAMIQSSFKELIYLDSDNAPLRELSHLFDAPRYVNGGRAAFWPDLNKDHPSNAIWRIVGDTCNFDTWSFESGQIVIDKAGNEGLNLAALQLAAHMQLNRDFWFHMCGGDKDTFRWAFRVLDIPFTMPSRWMSAAGFLDSYAQGRFCGHTTLQYDLSIPDGQMIETPLFAHSNLLKHLNGAGLGRGSLFTHIKALDGNAISSSLLNYVHGYVYHGSFRGMCLDFEHQPTADQDLPRDELWNIEILTLDAGSEYPDVGFLEEFDNAYSDLGGLIGGW